MGKILNRALARIDSIKASRATEQGVAGHQAVMSALGRAAIKNPDTLRGQVLSSTDKSGKTTHYIDTDPSKY